MEYLIGEQNETVQLEAMAGAEGLCQNFFIVMELCEYDLRHAVENTLIPDGMKVHPHQYAVNEG